MYRRALLIALILLAILVVSYFGTSFISYIFGEFYLNNPVFHILFAFILILLIVLFAIFIRNLVLFFFPHFKTNLRLKIFTAFVLLILGPALFTIFLSSSVVNKGLDRLLRIQVKRIVDTSQETVNSFIKLIVSDMEKDIDELYGRKVTVSLLRKKNLEGFLKLGKKKVKIGQVSVPSGVPLNGTVHHFEPSGILTVCKLKKKELICVSKKLPESLMNKIKNVKELRKNYQSLVTYKTPIKAVYTLTFILMGIAVLFGALWFARYFEKRITIPIEALYRATQKISKGNLNVQVEEEASDELKHVIQAFNYMVEQLRALKRSLEESKKYIEQILNNITPAIITFDYDGRVVSCNRAAKKLFGFSSINRGESIWKLLEKFPELKKGIDRLLSSGERKADLREEIGGREKYLAVELITSPEIKDRILIVEDVTDIVKAQKAQAWKEVARRIAHEIKNPLTPISLNAERLRRLFKKGDRAGVDKAVDSILEEVEVIKRLIDEFRKFARLPLPEKKLTDLNELIKSTLEPYDGKISLNFELEDIPQIPVDRSLMREVLINLVKNSVEAGATEVSVSTTSKNGKVFVVFKDNGPGIPEEVIEKLFSPYVSTKEEGWGLGLSIVKKIVEDHGGKIYTVDRNTFVIELPI